MKFTISRSIVAGAILGAGVALVIGYAPAIAQQGGTKPTVIATVQLSVVLEKLDQRAEAEANLNAMGADVRNDEAKKKAELTKMQADLDDMRKAANDGSAPPEAIALQEQLALKSLQYQAWQRFTMDKVDIEKALQWQELYRNIKSAAAQMASANGYDLVLVDDSQGELQTSPDSRTPRAQQIFSQIVSRRMLYANPTLDITDDLITRMNNAHKAAGAAAPKQ